jgi:GTP-binding protein HflX
MNALTDAGVVVEDRLFATLDTRTRKWYLEAGAEVLLSDTVGFVNHLPHHLVASFKATLEEAVNADLLLHVVDASSSDAFEQIESVNNVLEEIGCGRKQFVLLLNKIDIVRKKTVFQSLQTIYPHAISISAKIGMNLDSLRKKVLSRFKGDEIIVVVTCGAGDGKVQSFLRANGTIVEQNFSNNTARIKARLGKNQLSVLKSLKPTAVEISNKLD